MKKKILFLIVFSFTFLFVLRIYPVKAAGNTYYVAVNGDDNNSGTEGSPFKTIQKAADITQPGDVVNIREGVYKELLSITRSGTANARITFQAFENEQPIIDGSKNYMEWISDGNYYKTTVDVDVQIVIADEELLDPVNSLAELNESTFFQSGNDLYVWFPAGIDPNNIPVGVIKEWESHSEPSNIYISGDYIAISGITIRYSSGRGIIVYNASHTGVNDCIIKFSNMQGVYVSRGVNNKVLNCTIYQNVLSNYPRMSKRGGTWGQGLSFFSGANAEIAGNTVYKNHGEGIGVWGGWDYAGTNGVLIEKNTIYDSWGPNIYLDGVSNVLVDSNFSYNSGDYPKTLPGHEKNGKNFSTGIQLAKESNRPPFPGDLENIKIINNLFVDCQAGFGFWLDDSNSGLKNVLIANNTFSNNNVNDYDQGIYRSWTAISINNSDHHINTMFRNNILFQKEGSLVVYSDPIGEITFDYNNWHHSIDQRRFKNLSLSQNYDFSEWSDFQNRGNGSMFDDPKFDVGMGIFPDNYIITAISPAVDAGIDLVDVIVDFYGKTRPFGIGYDIGAFEYGKESGDNLYDIAPDNPDGSYGDGAVNALDFLLILQNWDKLTIDRSDINNDGIVNIQDSLLILQNWGS